MWHFGGEFPMGVSGPSGRGFTFKGAAVAALVLLPIQCEARRSLQASIVNSQAGAVMASSRIERSSRLLAVGTSHVGFANGCW